ncbi:MAG: LCP family protein [Clostridia bacterium]|nr:LCP family protein [Clostridia bacterium]
MGLSRRSLTKALLVLSAIIAVLVCSYIIIRSLETGNVEETRGTLDESFISLKRIEYDGKRYVQNNQLTTLLLIGVDKEEQATGNGYRSGGQADFLLLTVIDDESKSVRFLQIDRDTMTNITVLSVLGKKVGTRNAQICLSHGFGKTSEENCQYTVEAVQNLLEGTDIELYMAFDLNAISAINDALGGVTVTLNDDLSHLDAAMVPGATIRLQGKQAEYFVRSRYGVGDGSNNERMGRQKAFMDGAFSLIRQNASDASYLNDLYDRISAYATTNAAKSRIVSALSSAITYDVREIERLPGSHTLGSDGFMEFHPDEEAVTKWILDVFYTPE